MVDSESPEHDRPEVDRIVDNVLAMIVAAAPDHMPASAAELELMAKVDRYMTSIGLSLVELNSDSASGAEHLRNTMRAKVMACPN